MRFLADQNIPLPSMNRLRDASHDLVAVPEAFPASSDCDVLAHAAQVGCVILTFDPGYGSLGSSLV
jgi:hypothetical protein